MITLKRVSIRERIRVEHYFDCPHCGEEISDLDVGFSNSMTCPHCEGVINFVV